MEPRKCTKQPHKTIEGAERHRDALVRRGRARGPIDVYRCRICSAPGIPVYHVGHKRRKDPS